MRKSFIKQISGIAVLGIFLLSLGSFINKNDGTKTVTGEILDMKCYMASGAHGADHKECAATCINGGSPMGILCDDGKVYLLIKDDKKEDAYNDAKKYAGENVILTGTESVKGGVQALIVAEVKMKK
ncbi:MAG: hypothetical protein ACHQF0_00085 [Chitinophagales bacterium]